MSTSKTAEERYYEKVVPGLADRPECIGWRAKIDKYGNAVFSYTDETGRHDSNAARWAWNHFKEPLTAAEKIQNTCGLRSCQNLDHWEIKPTNVGVSLWEIYQQKFTRGALDECWPWQEKSRDRDGYGLISWRDSETKKTVSKRATRYAWEKLYGPIPDGEMVCHTCDNPPCQNPRHWFLGPAAANSADMIQKGRQYRGEAHHRATLTEAVVEEIRWLHQQHPELTHREIAERYGTTRKSVTNLLNNITWKKR